MLNPQLLQKDKSGVNTGTVAPMQLNIKGFSQWLQATEICLLKHSCVEMHNKLPINSFIQESDGFPAFPKFLVLSPQVRCQVEPMKEVKPLTLMKQLLGEEPLKEDRAQTCGPLIASYVFTSAFQPRWSSESYNRASATPTRGP